jgi:hypothetical protein
MSENKDSFSNSAETKDVNCNKEEVVFTLGKFFIIFLFLNFID